MIASGDAAIAESIAESIMASIRDQGWIAAIAIWMLVAGVTAFVLHGVDKRAAIKGRRRIPEARLHLVELLGGWPGALAAMMLFRHKIRKPSYLAVTVVIVVVWIAVPIWIVFAR